MFVDIKREEKSVIHNDHKTKKKREQIFQILFLMKKLRFVSSQS